MAVPAYFPPVIYFPCVQSAVTPNDATVRVRTTRDGRSALLVFSALDRLRTCVGPDEPWLVMPTERLMTVRESVLFDLVLLDVVVPQNEWAAPS
ncbi:MULTISPECIES: SAV_915 family protein [Nocardiaceae]|uniref:SAV_915 family protein n=1 Tax=Nocardiaceae TaxID=85025 RepID=UPI001E5FE0A8|nr:MULTISPECIES: SAV_915 family protein [Rhodococcus]